VKLRYPSRFAEIVEQTDDAQTGDILVQCALFGDLAYS